MLHQVLLLLMQLLLLFLHLALLIPQFLLLFLNQRFLQDCGIDRLIFWLAKHKFGSVSIAVQVLRHKCLAYGDIRCRLLHTGKVLCIRLADTQLVKGDPATAHCDEYHYDG